MQRQYSGTLGRIDNCQIGTFLAYANAAGDRVLIDRELYVPQESWFGDRARCAGAGIPAEVTFATRAQQVAAMIGRAVAAGVPFAWFTADEEFGQNPGLCAYLEDNQIAYVMAVPKTTQFLDAAGREVTVAALAGRLAPNAWQRRACGIGAKGFRVYDWALADSASPDHQFMIRRSVDDGELAFYRCFNPRRESFGELVRVAGARWPIGGMLRCQQERSRPGQLPGPPLPRLVPAHHLVHARAGIPRRHPERRKKGLSRPGRQPPRPGRPDRPANHPPARKRPRLIPLSTAEIRRLLSLPRGDTGAVDHRIYWSAWRRAPQGEARWHHFRRRLRLQTLQI